MTDLRKAITGYEKVPQRLQQYVDYIKNTKRVPLPVAFFDDDWEPIGPKVREELMNRGFIYYHKNGGILLRPDLENPSYG